MLSFTWGGAASHLSSVLWCLASRKFAGPLDLRARHEQF